MGADGAWHTQKGENASGVPHGLMGWPVRGCDCRREGKCVMRWSGVSMPAAAVPPTMPVTAAVMAAMVSAMVAALVSAMVAAMVAVMGMVMIEIAEAETQRDRRSDIGRITVVAVAGVIGVVGGVGRIRAAPNSNSEQQYGDEPDCPAFASRVHDQSIPNWEHGFSLVVRTKFST